MNFSEKFNNAKKVWLNLLSNNDIDIQFATPFSCKVSFKGCDTSNFGLEFEIFSVAVLDKSQNQLCANQTPL